MHVKYELLQRGRWVEVDQATWFKALKLADGVYCLAYSWLGKRIIWFSKREAVVPIGKFSHVETVTGVGERPRTMSAGPGGLVPEHIDRYFSRRARKQYIEIVRPQVSDATREQLVEAARDLSALDKGYSYGGIGAFISRVLQRALGMRPGRIKDKDFSAKHNICGESRVRILRRGGGDVIPDGEVPDQVSPGEAYTYETLAGAQVVARASVS